MIHIAGYSVIGQIGRGGMATVYRARQTLLDREVALKVMSTQLAQDPVYAQRFLQEARMLAALNHPHVVPVYDIGVSTEGLHYFSMQLLGGGDFAGRMRDGISEQELVRVLIAVANALGFAHARGYVHRDVTPSNIMFDAHDAPVLTDFGIARAVTATSRITASGLSIGTSHYMSPEQARGAEVDHRSDIYSLGALCFEALAGHPPFEGEDTFAVAFAHVHDPVPALPEEVSHWQPLIDRAMAKEPVQRFADCGAFIDALRQIAPDADSTPVRAGLSTPGRPSLTPPPKPLVVRAVTLPSRPPLSVLGLGAIAGVIIGLAVWMLIAPDAATPPAETASVPASGDRSTDPASETHPLGATDPAATGAGIATSTDAAASEPSSELAESDVLTVSDALHTVTDPVAALLVLGRESLAALRLTQPAGNNAMERFRLVLAMEPGNADAAAGISEVADRYLELASRRDPATETEAWVSQLRLAAQVAAEHPAAAAKGDLARATIQSFVGAQIERGQTAIVAWDRQAASEAFARVRLVEPDNADVAKGLALAARVGTVGFQFNDSTSAETADMPELVVVSDRLALGRSEVTVAQFRAYWDAAGKQRFGPDLPSCRDREAGGPFHSTRGRTWLAPSIDQDARHPVVCISVAMAQAYVDWLGERTGHRYRLPSVSELEALAPSASGNCDANLRDQAYKEKFGGRDHATCGDSYAATAPVGSFVLSAPGLHDMRGNVREWSNDCTANCRERIAFGLGWHSVPDEPLRASFNAEQAFNTIGMRVARELDRSAGMK